MLVYWIKFEKGIEYFSLSIVMLKVNSDRSRAVHIVLPHQQNCLLFSPWQEKVPTPLLPVYDASMVSIRLCHSSSGKPMKGYEVWKESVGIVSSVQEMLSLKVTAAAVRFQEVVADVSYQVMVPLKSLSSHPPRVRYEKES